MSYSVYKTESIIMRIIPNGEANRDVVFLTRDLGKITARSQSARKIESKMRMHLTRYNHVVIDVVHGKIIWRLTGIHAMDNHNLFQDNKILHAWHRAMTLVEHLIRGEEAHPELFDFFVGILGWIDKNLSPNPSPARGGEPNMDVGLELFLVIHVLEKLGYWNGDVIPEIPNAEILEEMSSNKKELVAKINASLEATQIV
jgi:recombinational DNA repair protein (RecF pathway)